MKLPLIPWLILGDSAVLALVTAAGFATHGTLQSAGGRLLATFIPLLVTWLLLAGLLGQFKPELLNQPRQLWRVALGVVLASLAAAIGRAAWTGGAITPIFVMILVATNTLAMLVWRAVLVILTRQGRVIWMRSH
jgi:hypothetical protein